MGEELCGGGETGGEVSADMTSRQQVLERGYACIICT